MKKLIIAIDGPVGSGKSTLARRVAELMDYVYIDTGAMYRALALKAVRRGLGFDHDSELETLAGGTRIDLKALDGTQQVFLDGEEVTTAIRTPEVSQAASKIAVVSGVRHVLVAEQRRAGQQGGVVMEGRDIGSVVFPDADLKIFLTASPEVRADRRYHEHQQKGDAIDRARTLDEIHERSARPRTNYITAGSRSGCRGGGQHCDGSGGSGSAGGDAGEGQVCGRDYLGKGTAGLSRHFPISRNPMWCALGFEKSAQAGVPVPLKAKRRRRVCVIEKEKEKEKEMAAS